MKYFVIDAFYRKKYFQGNPAGVCILEKPLKQKNNAEYCKRK